MLSAPLDRSARPLVGITCGRVPRGDRGDFVLQAQSETYVSSILRAGGVPSLLPAHLDAEARWVTFQSLDALLLAGGDDLDPALYGEPPHETTCFDDVRDASELGYLALALAANLPVLGVCRGMQLLNVARGGSMYQDIPSMLPEALPHRGGHHNLDHLYSLRPGSSLEEVLGVSEIRANAFHHQAVRVLGEGLVADAWTADGVVEALSLPSARWVLGVQCHPESLEDLEPRWERLFSAFIRAAR